MLKRVEGSVAKGGGFLCFAFIFLVLLFYSKAATKMPPRKVLGEIQNVIESQTQQKSGRLSVEVEEDLLLTLHHICIGYQRTSSNLLALIYGGDSFQNMAQKVFIVSAIIW